jgi:predicted transcriptional regulator
MGRRSEINRDEHYDAIVPEMPHSRREVFLELRSSEPRGLTRYELAERLRRPVSSICGRMKELEDSGMVVDTDETRPTTYGGKAVVMRIAPAHRTEKPTQMEFSF